MVQEKGMKDLRVAIIGGGFGLRVQAPIIYCHQKMKISSISTMKRHQIPNELMSGEQRPAHYHNWMEMLDQEELDLLFVSSIPIHHFEMVKYAIKKGIHVVCEKPFMINSKESKQLLTLSNYYNIKVVIDFEWRYLPVRQKVKKIIQNGDIGKILHFDYHISSPEYQNLRSMKKGWMGERNKFGGMLGALGSHMIDCMKWLTNDDIETMNSYLFTHIPEGGGEMRDADDAFFLHGKLKNHTSFSLQLLSGVNHGFGSELKIYGHLGTIRLSNDNNLFFGKVNEELKQVLVQTDEKIPTHLSNEARAYYPAFYPFIEKVYEYITLNTLDEDLPTIKDGHENQTVLDRILFK